MGEQKRRENGRNQTRQRQTRATRRAFESDIVTGTIKFGIGELDDVHFSPAGNCGRADGVRHIDVGGRSHRGNGSKGLVVSARLTLPRLAGVASATTPAPGRPRSVRPTSLTSASFTASAPSSAPNQYAGERTLGRTGQRPGDLGQRDLGQRDRGCRDRMLKECSTHRVARREEPGVASANEARVMRQTAIRGMQLYRMHSYRMLSYRMQSHRMQLRQSVLGQNPERLRPTRWVKGCPSASKHRFFKE